MIARMPGYGYSEPLTSRFSQQELNDMAHDTRGHIEARRDLIQAGGIISDVIKSKAKAAAKLGMESLLRHASFIVTTLSSATSNGFNIYRQATAVVCEEADRIDDAEMVGLFSQYLYVHLGMLGGSWIQLPPMMFGPELENNFRVQGYLSLLARLYTTGFFIPELMYTARFKNEELSEICRIVNDDPSLKPVEGVFDPVATTKARDIMAKVWGVRAPVIFVNVKNSTVLVMSDKFSYSAECTLTAMYSLEKRLEYGDDQEIVYLTFYNAELNVVRALIRAAQDQAKAANNHALANRWARIITSTVDSYVGNDDDHVMPLGDGAATRLSSRRSRSPNFLPGLLEPSSSCGNDV